MILCPWQGHGRWRQCWIWFAGWIDLYINSPTRDRFLRQWNRLFQCHVRTTQDLRN
jgi:hypothetical protein